MTTNNKSVKSNREKANLAPLSELERALIYGTMLGDGHIQKRNNKSFRLKIDHSFKQAAFVYWKHNKLKRLCETTQPPKLTTDKYGHQGLEFYSTSGEYLQEVHEDFYVSREIPVVSKQTGEISSKKSYTKVITQKLINKLPMHPYVLATWFMDDGSVRGDCYAGKIATQGFPREDSLLLVSYLEQWGINGAKVTKHTEKSGQFYISLPATGKTFETFINIIEPVVREIPEMVYKLNEARKPRND